MGSVAVALRRRADALADVGPRGMISVARAVKEIGRVEAARATGGSGRMTGKKRRGIRLRVFDTIDQGHSLTFLTVKGRPAGPWVWVTTGTRRHEIRRRKRGPMRKMTVTHPGTRGKGAWRDVQTRARRVVPEIFRDEVHAVLS